MQKLLLLVDDEPNILKSLSRMFADDGYQIFTATRPKDGLDILAKNPIQVIISDHHMPDMTGVAFLEKVKNAYPDTIRMILSASSDFEVAKDAINDGSIYKFLSKPWDDGLIRQHVKDAFQLYSDVSKQKKAEQELNKLMYFDPLTGLPNRFALNEHLDHYLKIIKTTTNTLAFLWINIDHFSKIRDKLGEESTNQLLQIFTANLKHTVQDVYLARVGYDEFFVILSAKSKIELEGLIKDIFDCGSQPIEVVSKVYLSISIGVSFYPQDGGQYELLLQNSRRALSTCKEQGGNKIAYFSADSKKDADIVVELESDLHEALDKQQFVLYYQPIISLVTDDVIGVEALIRWNHPKRGIVPPDLFLSICESTGLIIPIGEWVVRTACQAIKQFNKATQMDLHLAVNLSTKQFMDLGLYDLITNTIETTKINPSILVLEVTESLLMCNIEENLKILKALCNLGLKLSIDDFGTGYSSLSYLRKMPFHILKIDKLFVQDIGNTKNSDALVIAIISMAQSLDLEIVAEGVETKEQLEFLKIHKCDSVQGYFFSKPKPLNELLDFIINRKAAMQ